MHVTAIAGKKFHLSTYLTRRVHYFRRKLLALVFDDTTKGILNGRVVAFDKLSLDVSYGERGFA